MTFQIQNIFSGQHGTVQSLDLSNLGNIIWTDPKKIEIASYKVVELKIDILVLSSCLYRKTQENYIEFKGCSVLDKKVEENIMEQDYVLASKMKDFYSKKFMMLTLKEKSLSSFRKDLIRLINTENFVYKDDAIKIAHKLPWFYHYDIGMVELFKDTSIPKEKYTNSKVKLKFEKKLDPSRKGFSQYNYFFKNENNTVYCFPIQKNNPLLHLFEHEIFNHEVCVEGKFFLNNKDGYNYYNSADWKLIYENNSVR